MYSTCGMLWYILVNVLGSRLPNHEDSASPLDTSIVLDLLVLVSSLQSCLMVTFAPVDTETVLLIWAPRRRVCPLYNTSEKDVCSAVNDVFMAVCL